ncbi:MAG: hypothetical protein KDC38_04965, partial [Planctomycetes bacterium]|nr:hypothetical protein [Planctomycetota bacterium]
MNVPSLFVPALALGLHLAASAPASPGLTIVAPDSWSTELSDFVAHRSKTIRTELLTLESVLAPSPDASSLARSQTDEAERLKRALFEAWRDRGTRYVLLVGDADVMPIRYMTLDRVTAAAFDVAFYPSDLYYADLVDGEGAFETWNGEREGFHAGYFGEVRGEKNKDDVINFDRVHYLPELAVGRWPVSTLEQLRVVIQKTIAHDAQRAEEDRAEATKPSFSFIAVDGWVDMRARMERWAKACERRFSVERRYFADAAHDYGVPAPTAESVLELLGERGGVVVHAGHGSDQRWEKCLDRSALTRLDNRHRLPVCISA